MLAIANYMYNYVTYMYFQDLIYIDASGQKCFLIHRD